MIARNVTFGNRLPFAPEFRFNVFNKYTFTNNFVGDHGRGFSVGLGARYSSEMNIGLTQDYSPSRGGVKAGNYVVFDTVFGYPIEVMGYRMNGSLNVSNVFDKEYSEGNIGLAPSRSYLLTLGLKF